MAPETSAYYSELSKRVDDVQVDVREMRVEFRDDMKGLRSDLSRLADAMIEQRSLKSRVIALEQASKDESSRKFQSKLAWMTPILGGVLGVLGGLVVPH